MEIVYAVRYIEVEFGWGDRPFGWKLYTDKERCKTETKQKSTEAGNDAQNGSDYYGPERPLVYEEIPLDCIDEKDKEILFANGVVHTADRWEPKFKSSWISIK